MHDSISRYLNVRLVKLKNKLVAYPAIVEFLNTHL